MQREKRGKEERGGEEECFQRLQVQEKVYRGSFPNLYKHLVRTIHWPVEARAATFKVGLNSTRSIFLTRWVGYHWKLTPALPLGAYGPLRSSSYINELHTRFAFILKVWKPTSNNKAAFQLHWRFFMRLLHSSQIIHVVKNSLKKWGAPFSLNAAYLPPSQQPFMFDVQSQFPFTVQ